MKTIITYGTFDLYHVGHVRLLKRLSEMGDRLVVGISTDEFNEVKGKRSVYSYEERAEIVSSSQYVDLVFPENCWSQKESDIKKHGADIFVMGDDWSGKFDHLKDNCNVVYLPRTENISTTKIKTSLSAISDIDLKKIEESLTSAFSVLQTISK